MGGREDYNFLSIRDAISSLNQKVNLMGVVVEFGIPKRSKGTDCFCTLKIMDESCQGNGLPVNCFAENMEMVPHVKSAGDIIRLSQVLMKSHHGEVNATFKKNLSSFALFEGKSSKGFIPYQASSNFRITDPDKEFITCLRKWLLNFQLDSGTHESLLLLRQIKKGKGFDLLCKVLHVCGDSEDSWMLFVWDGTDTPPLSCETRLNDEMQNPLLLQLEPLPLPRNILCTFPSVGTILRVTVDQPGEKLGPHFPGSGRWVKFLNLTCQVHLGLWHGVFVSSTKLRILSDEDNNVIHRQKVYEERLSSKWDRMPFSTFPWPSHITETEYEHVPFVTLMDVLTYSKTELIEKREFSYPNFWDKADDDNHSGVTIFQEEEKLPRVTAKFKCVVRVVAMCPWRAEDFRSPLGACSYRMRLTLEDPTARIHALIYAEDGENFFDGYPSMDVLTCKRNKLLGITEGVDGKIDESAPRNPPWVQCCIKSYYLDKGDPWGTRNYRIFGTRLVA